MPKITLIFVIAFLGSIYAIFYYDAYYGLLMYVAVYFFNPNSTWWGASLPQVRYMFIISLLTIIGFLLRYNKYSDNHIFDAPQSKWIFSLIILMGLVSFIAVWPENHWKYYPDFVKYQIFVFLMLKMVDTPEKFEKIIGVYILSVFNTAWLAHSIGRQEGDRLGTGVIPGSDENGVSAMLAPVVPFLLFYILEGRRWQKLASLFALAYVFDGIILCNSRGGFLAIVGLTIYMGYFLLFKKVKDYNYKLKVGIGVIGAICLFFYLVDPAFIGRASSLKKGAEADGSGEHSRIYFWMKAIDMAKDHPYGTGAGGYMFLSPQYLPGEVLVPPFVGQRAEHSIWAQFLAEYGFLGLTLFIGLVFSNFNLLRKLRNMFNDAANSNLYFQSVALGASLIARLIANSFLSTVYSETGYWIMGFIAVFGNIYLNKRNLVSEAPPV